MPRTLTSSMFTRLSLVFCFLAFGLWEVINPTYWIGYAPAFASHIADPKLLVLFHGIALTIVALGLLSRKLARLFALLAILILVEILLTVWFTIGWGDILIRDITIFVAALGLFAVQDQA